MLLTMSMQPMNELPLQTPPPRAPSPRDDRANLAPPPPRASGNESDDLEPYNLPFTD